jgi:two-component system NtrC family sensor kinase
MAQLIGKGGPVEGSVFLMTSEVTTLGRNPENDVVLNDAAASRFHAEIVRSKGAFHIHDLDSTHGTFVNDERNTAELQLKNNDIVRIGHIEFVFRADDASKSAADVASDEKAAALVGNEKQTVKSLPTETVAFTIPSAKTATTGGLSERHFQMLSRVAGAIQSLFDVDELLVALMDVLFNIFKPDRGVVFLYDGPESKLTPKVTRPANSKVQVSKTIIRHAIQQRMSLLIADTQGDQRFSAAQSVILQAIQSAICCPLVHKDQVLGVLYIDTQSHLITYQKEDLALLNIIAAHASIAIENAILVQEKLQSERLASIGVAVAGISHYAKNILTGIIGSSILIEEGLKENNLDRVKEAWPILQRSNRKISSVVQDMLTYSKRCDPLLAGGNVNDVLRDVYEEQQARAEKMSVELMLELDETLPDSQFDQQALHDCLLNIVSNAIEACATTPAAMVVLHSGVQPESGDLFIWIIDSGPGIPPEIQQKIYEPFFTTKGSKGTGLGLAVVRKVIDEHRGRLELDSAPGRGATFKIFLPL